MSDIDVDSSYAKDIRAIKAQADANRAAAEVKANNVEAWNMRDEAKERYRAIKGKLSYPEKVDPYVKAVQAAEKLKAERERWELVRNSGEDQRIFRRRGNGEGLMDGALYLADHSGSNPDRTTDGPLRVVPPDDSIDGSMDWKSFRFSIRVAQERYEKGAYWSTPRDKVYTTITMGLGVANWLAHYYGIRLRLLINDREWYYLTSADLPLPVPKDKAPKPERRITL